MWATTECGKFCSVDILYSVVLKAVDDLFLTGTIAPRCMDY